MVLENQMNPLDSLPGMASVMLRYGVGLVLCLFNETRSVSDAGHSVSCKTTSLKLYYRKDCHNQY